MIGGYLPGSATFDSILVGYYEGRDLMYASRIRNGFTPASRQALFSNFEGLSISKSPFRSLPESGKGRWGEGLTAEDMKKSLAQAAARRRDRIPRMDARQSSPPPEVCGDTRRSERGGGHTGVIIKRCSFYRVLALPEGVRI